MTNITFIVSVLILYCITTGVVAGKTRTVTLPIEYIPANLPVFLSSHEYHIAIANLDCPALNNATIEVCAELPNNWQWEPQRGTVFLNIFNQVSEIEEVSIDSIFGIIYLYNIVFTVLIKTLGNKASAINAFHVYY